MKTAQCPNCDLTSPFLFNNQDYNSHITEEYFDHFKCRNCKLIFISPVPENLGKYYPSDYHTNFETLEEIEQAAQSESYKLDLVKRFVNHGDLLEIGPSYGRFALLAKKAGFSVQTIEMDSECCDLLKNVLNIKVTQSDNPAEAIQSFPEFDAIALWHVIEHLPNFCETLEHIAHHLKDGGHLFLAAPNPNSIQFKFMGKRWPHVDSPRHLSQIPTDLLKKKLAKLGLRQRLMTTNYQGSDNYDKFGWVFFFGSFSKNPTLNRLFKIFGFITSQLLRPLEKINGNGSTYIIVFEKVSS